MLDGWREEVDTVEILDGECEAAAQSATLGGYSGIARSPSGTRSWQVSVYSISVLYRRPEARLCNAIHIWYQIRAAYGRDESKSTNHI